MKITPENRKKAEAFALKLIDAIDDLLSQLSAQKRVTTQEQDKAVHGLLQVANHTLRSEVFNPKVKGVIQLETASPVEQATIQVLQPSLKLEDQIHEWSPSKENIVEDLEKFKKQMYRCQNTRRYKEAYDFFHRLVEKLIQVDPSNTKLWSQISADEARKALSHLDQIGRTISLQLELIGLDDPKYHFRESFAIDNLYVLQAMHAIARRLPPDETLLFQLLVPSANAKQDTHAMLLPKSTYKNSSLFKGSSLRITNNPEHNQYLASLERQYGDDRFALFSESSISLLSFNSSSPGSVLYQVLQLWLQNPENLQKIRELEKTKAAAGKFDLLNQDAKINSLFTNYKELLLKPFLALLNGARRVHESFNVRSRDQIQSQLNALQKSPLPHTNSIEAKAKQILFLATFPPFQNEALEKLCHLLCMDRQNESDVHAENSVLVSNFEAQRLQLAVEEYQDILSIRAESEFQIPMTLDYFTKHKSKLKDPDYQTILKILLFEDTILQDDLKDTPQRAEQIANFLRSAYELFESQNDYETCGFLLNLASTLNDYSKGSIAPFDVSEKFKILIAVLGKKPEAHKRALAVMHAFRLASLSYRISQIGFTATPEEASEIFYSRYFLQQFALDDKKKDKRCEWEIETTLFHAQPLFQKLVRDVKTKDRFLNAFFSKLKNEPCSYIWKEDPVYPLFLTQDGAFQLNVATGDILCLKEQGFFHRVPYAVLQNSDFKKFFGLHEPLCSVISKTLFDVKDPQGIIYRVRLLQAGGIAIFRKFVDEGTSWYRYTPSGTAGVDLIKSSEITNGHEKWTSQDTPQIVYYLDVTTKKAVYKLESGILHKVTAPAWKLFNISEIDDIRELPTFVQATAFLKKFEHASYTHIWFNSKDRKVELEVPRFDLHFTYDATKTPQQWLAKEHPGYFLAASQELVALDNVKGFLVLENRLGQKKVLICNQKIKPREPQDLSTDVSFDNGDPTVDFSEKQKYYEYQVAKNGALVPTNVAARFHLATLYVAKASYSSAAELLILPHAEIQDRALDTEELEALRRLCDVSRKGKVKDESAEACAIRLHARFLLYRDRHRSGVSESAIKDELQDEYHALKMDLSWYLGKLNQLDELALPLFEEELLIKWYLKLQKKTQSDSDEIVIQRAKQLGIYLENVSEAADTMTNSVVPPEWKRMRLGDPIWKWDVSAFLQPQQASVKENGFPFLPLFSSNEEMKQAFGALYDRAIQAKTDEEKRQIFILVYPLYAALTISSIPSEKESLAALLLAALFTPHDFPNTFSEFCQRIKAENSPEKWLNAQVQKLQFPESTNNWITEPKLYNMQPSVPKKRAEIVPVKPSVTDIDVSLQLPPLSQVADTLNVVDVADYFDKEKELGASTKEKQALKQEFSQIFSLQHPEAVHETVVQNYYQAMQNDIAVGLEKENPRYRLKDQNISALLSSLQAKLEDENDQLSYQEAKILYLARKESAKPEIRSQFSRGKKSYPSMEELIIYFGQQNWKALQERNPALTQNDIVILRELIQMHLLSKTRAQKIERAILTCQALKSAQGREKDELIQQLAENLLTKREYDVTLHPAFLALEAFSEIILRKEQVATIALFFDKKDLQPACQLIMGAGKTTAIAPLIALLRADGEKISCMIAPKQLIGQLAAILRTLFGGAFRRSVTFLTFHRSHLTDAFLQSRNTTAEAYLEDLLQQLESTRKNRNLLLMTPETRHSLICALDEGLYLKKLSGRALQLLRKIAATSRALIVDTIDEIDQVLSPRLEFNYSIGKKKPYEQDKGKLICHLVSQARQLHPEGLHFSKESYQNISKVKLAQRVVEDLVGNPIVVEHDQAEENLLFLKSLSPQEKKLIQAYLTGKRSAKIDDLLEKFPEKLFEYLQLSRTIINSILPTALGKVCYEQYGFREDPKNPLSLVACPFEAACSPKVTDFASPEEQIVFSALTVFSRGVSDAVVYDFCMKLKAQALQEINHYKMAFTSTESYRQFIALRGTSRLLLQDVTEENVSQITASLKTNQEFLLRFTEGYLLPNIEVDDKKITSTPYTLAQSGSSESGFTGTLEKSLLPKEMTAFPEVGTNAKTLIAIAKKLKKASSTISAIRESQAPLHTQLLGKLDVAGSNAPLMLIDSGGWLKNVSVASFAYDFLSKTKHRKQAIQGVIFHNDKGELVSLERRAQGYVTIPLRESYLKENERVTIIAQKYCTGTNIKQPSTSKALMTLSKTMTLRDFLQGAFRMRGILGEQNFDFLYSEEMASSLREKLSENNEPIDFEKFVRFFTTNHCYKLADDNLLAVRQKMQAYIQDIARRQILDLKKTEQAAEQIFDATSELFVSQVGDEALLKQNVLHETSEGYIQEMVEMHVQLILPHIKANPDMGLDVLSRAIKSGQKIKLPRGTTIASLGQSKDLATLLIQIVEKIVRTDLASLADKGAIRTVLSKDLSEAEYGKETESESEQEKQKEVEKELELEVVAEGQETERIPQYQWAAIQKGRGVDLLQWKKNFEQKPLPKMTIELNRFCSLRDALNKGFLQVAKAFNKKLTFSANFAGHVRGPSRNMKPQFFDKLQKTAHQVFIVQEAGKPSRVLLISLHEAKEIKQAMKALTLTQKQKLKSDKVSFAIYDPTNGLDAQVGELPDPKTDQELFEQIVQVKFLNGALSYSKEEIAYLQKWFLQNNPKKMYDFFVKDVLANRTETKKEFLAGSYLQREFNRAIAKFTTGESS